MTHARPRISHVAAVLLVLVALVLAPAATSAHRNLFRWNTYNTVCGAHGQAASAYIKEQGTTGATWMRITAQLLRWNGSSWRITRTSYYQNNSQFPNDHRDHSLTWRKSFRYRGNDYYRPTRILFWYQWYRNNTLLETRSEASATCYP